MTDVSVNHLLLQMLSKSFRDSCMRFCNRAERQVRAGSARGPDRLWLWTAHQAKAGPSDTADRATGGRRREAPRDRRTRSSLHSTRRQAGGQSRAGRTGNAAHPPTPAEGRPGVGQPSPLEGLQLMERTCTMHAGAGAAPPSSMSTRNHGPCRVLYRGLIQFHQQGWEGARIPLGNINRGRRDPRINPELEADTRGQRLGGDLAVALVQLRGLVGWLGRG